MAGGLFSEESDGQSGGPLMAEINVTPFVDVMLVLLIIFMVAAPLMMVGVPINLPKTSAPRIAQTQSPSVVTVDKAGGFFLKQEAMEEDALIARLKEAATGQENPIVYLRADKDVSYGRVMEAMGKIAAAGVGRVSLLAEGPALKPGQ